MEPLRYSDAHRNPYKTNRPLSLLIVTKRLTVVGRSVTFLIIYFLTVGKELM